MFLYDFDIIHFKFILKYVLGKCIFTWLSRQCKEVETKVEYDQSYCYFKAFLTDQWTCRDLSAACHLAVVELQENLHSKEAKLGNHFCLLL